MSDEKKSFLDSNLYPILFMLVITIVFVGILSVLYRSTEKGISIYREQTYQLQILTLFADTLATRSNIKVEQLTDRKQLDKNYKLFITEKSITGSDNKTVTSKYFVAILPDGSIIGYCFDITGSGLWGTMKGLLAVTPDFGKIINYAIYDQMETPGLGGRVEESWFKKQFAGKPLLIGGKTAEYVLVPENAPITAIQVKQITGSTITSASVLKMLKAAFEVLSKTQISKQVLS